MNPMTNMKNVLKLSDQELRSSMKTSWHDQYKNSAWIFVGGLPFDLTEGDVICVFSQYGEIVNLNLVRDKGTGRSRGFCFICYEDQRSTNLAVDNFNGIKLLNRTIRVDHCEDYKAPKDDKMDEDSRRLHAEGCAPGSNFGHIPQLPSSSLNSNRGLDKGLNSPPMESLLNIKTDTEESVEKQKRKKELKEKKTKDDVRKMFPKKKKVRKSSSSSSSNDSSSSDSDDPKTKKKTPKVLKQKKEKASTSSSDDIAVKFEKQDDKLNEKIGKAQLSYKRPSKHQLSDIEEERRSSKKKKSTDGEGRKLINRPEQRKYSTNFSDTRQRDDYSKTVYHKNHGDEKKTCDLSSEWSDEDNNDKYRVDTKRYGSDRRDAQNNKKYSNDGYREDTSRHERERKWRDHQRDNEYYKKKDSGGHY